MVVDRLHGAALQRHGEGYMSSGTAALGSTLRPRLGRQSRIRW